MNSRARYYVDRYPPGPNRSDGLRGEMPRRGRMSRRPPGGDRDRSQPASRDHSHPDDDDHDPNDNEDQSRTVITTGGWRKGDEDEDGEDLARMQEEDGEIDDDAVVQVDLFSDAPPLMRLAQLFLLTDPQSVMTKGRRSRLKALLNDAETMELCSKAQLALLMSKLILRIPSELAPVPSAEAADASSTRGVGHVKVNPQSLPNPRGGGVPADVGLHLPPHGMGILGMNPFFSPTYMASIAALSSATAPTQISGAEMRSGGKTATIELDEMSPSPATGTAGQAPTVSGPVTPAPSLPSTATTVAAVASVAPAPTTQSAPVGKK